MLNGVGACQTDLDPHANLLCCGCDTLGKAFHGRLPSSPTPSLKQGEHPALSASRVTHGAATHRATVQLSQCFLCIMAFNQPQPCVLTTE